MSNRLRVVFAGTPYFAVPSLQALIEQRFDVVAVYTQPDRPQGRGRKITPGPIKTIALENQLAVYQPKSLKNPAAIDEFAALQPDVMVVAAYGLILPQQVLDIPTYGCINVHGSILPEWRGAAPIQRAIAAGDTTLGVTIMQMDAGLDTGEMLLKGTIPLGIDDSCQTMLPKLATLGADLLVDTLHNLNDKQQHAEPQIDSQASYAHKISKAECAIDFNQPALAVHNKIRAFDCRPAATTCWEGSDVKVWQSRLTQQKANGAAPGTWATLNKKQLVIACQDDWLEILSLQLPNKPKIQAQDFINAFMHQKNNLAF